MSVIYQRTNAFTYDDRSATSPFTTSPRVKYINPPNLELPDAVGNPGDIIALFQLFPEGKNAITLNRYILFYMQFIITVIIELPVVHYS